MNCPLCSAKAEDGAAECPSCGAIFAKLREKKEREKQEAAAALAKAAVPVAEASSPATVRLNIWMVRGAAVAMVLAWVLGFGVYYHGRIKDIKSKPGFGTKKPDLTRATVQDPSTGKMIEVEVRKAPSTAAPTTDKPSRESDPPKGAIPHDPDFDD